MEARAAGRHLADVALALLLFAITLFFTHRGAGVETSFVFQLGPNDHAYLSGFAPHYEVAGEEATRWTTYHATIDLPLTLEGGPGEISYRFSRVFAETAEAAVSLGGSTVDRFTCRGGEIQTRGVRLPSLGTTPLVVGFEVDSHEQKNMGLRLDWVRIDAGESGRLRPRGWALHLPPVMAAFFFALFRFGGIPRPAATLSASLWIAAVAFWVPRDPFGFSHIVLHCGVASMALSIPAGLILRRLPSGRWVIPLLVLGYLVKAAALFHPTTFYPDVANAKDYVEVFRETSGSLAERGVETQTLTNVGYPRAVGGKEYAFPYSPLYFLPFGAFSSPGGIEDAVRHGGLSAAALAVIPLFWLGLHVFGERAAILATFAWALMPPIVSRLLLALHATVVGNFLDLLVMAAVVALALEPGSHRRTVVVAATTLASLLVYTSSLFSVSAFFLFMASLERRIALRLLAILFVCGTVTVTWLYWPFLIAFFGEIVPAVAAGDATPAAASEAPGVLDAVRRIPLFYGYLYPVLAVVGFVVARRRSSRVGLHFVVAYGLAFALMLGLRAFGAGLFKDLKEITFVAPLVALLAGAAIDAIWKRARWGPLAACTVLAALTWFGVSRTLGYLEAYAPALMQVESRDATSSSVIEMHHHANGVAERIGRAQKRDVTVPMHLR